MSSERLSQFSGILIDPSIDDKAANYYKGSMQISSLIEAYDELSSKIETTKKRLREELDSDENARDQVAEKVMEFARKILHNMDRNESDRQKRVRQQNDADEAELAASVSSLVVCNDKIEL